MDTFKSYIGRWGRPENLAEDLGIPTERARKWALRESIPAEYWLSVIAAAKGRKLSRGMTLERFALLAEWARK